MKKDRTCKHCEKLFKNIEGRVFSNHVRWCEKNPKNPRNEKYIKTLSEKSKLNEERKHGRFLWFEVSCGRCGVGFCVKEREKTHPLKDKYFCSRSCANSKNSSGPQTEESKRKVAETSKKWWKNPEYIEKQLKIKNKKFFSSKGEEDLKKYIQSYDIDGEWTYGGSLSFKGVRICRDLYSKKLKVCIEYDGIWHFKDINNQLKDKQHKDKMLEEWCLENGYKLIRIDEDIYKKNNYWWKHIILDEVYNGKDQIVKFGDKY